MNYAPTTASAIEYADSGRLEEWVHAFLCNEGGNKAFSDGLKLEKRCFLTPRKMELALFRRCCGPEDEMQYPVSRADFEKRVDAIAERYANTDWDMPPLIIYFDNGTYQLNDGNHRYEALKQLGVEAYWVILWKTDGEIDHRRKREG